MSKNKEPAFLTSGFDNWKKATSRFESHQASESHRIAVATISSMSQLTIDVQMNTNLRQQQEVASKALLKVFQSLRYLLRQGLPFRGHAPEEGNFIQLLKLFREGDGRLDEYLKRTMSFTSPQAQEEIIQMFSQKIVRTLAKDIARNGPFGVMVDGTQYISGVEQKSICFRHVDDNLHVHEDFVGLYELPITCGKVIANLIFDVITRLSLPSDNLRAQTYDGAANMMGRSVQMVSS
ncbi:PREDICTED: zinc finger MYM-type protein 1-like [Priapulus caudatus]|uniref:Zinc finger MYM-type protein 1-like n=1 Tax=Priapulus caudatus TaxID=37621 RepID=A0ABM1DZN2_PRICU|nr:PREDICTED: zinc finger MYM-type protein 1-like [Priapulus caudatus]